ncbi:8992_t:CDS:1, partial [Racocetra fulgida]
NQKQFIFYDYEDAGDNLNLDKYNSDKECEFKFVALNNLLICKFLSFLGGEIY